MAITVEELKYIIQKAYTESSLSQKALESYYQYKLALESDQDDILAHNKLLSETKTIDIKELRARAERDTALGLQLRNILKDYKPDEAYPYAVATHKIPEHSDHKIFDDESNMYNIINGKAPQAYDNNIGLDEPQLMGLDNGTIYGNSRSSFSSCAYLQANIELQKSNDNLSTSLGAIDIPLQRNRTQRLAQKTSWVDDAAIGHVGALPKGVRWSDLTNINPEFSRFSFRFQDEIYTQQGLDGLAFIHSGYAFGGDREKGGGWGRYEIAKSFGPHDCSSWTASITDCPLYSTNHLLAVYRKQLHSTLNTNADELMLSKVCQKISDTYEAIDINRVKNNPKDLLKPGMLFGLRGFNEKYNKENSLGNSGHVVLALGATSTGEVLTLGYNRDMPNIEGFGFRVFSLEEKSDEEKMLFAIKN